MVSQYFDIEPFDKRFTTNQAKGLFLDTISRDAHEVLEHLSSIRMVSPMARSGNSVVLKQWSERWNLNADWITESACQTIEFHEVFPDSKFMWFPLSVGWQVPLNDLGTVEPPTGLPTWEILSEPRMSYMERVEELIKSILKEEDWVLDLPQNIKFEIKEAKLEIAGVYCDALVKSYLELRDRKGKELWVATKKRANLQRNARWTVQFQVLQRDFVDIANAEGLEHSTIKRAIEDFLSVIQLPRRMAKRGRRQGQTKQKLAEKRKI